MNKNNKLICYLAFMSIRNINMKVNNKNMIKKKNINMKVNNKNIIKIIKEINNNNAII